MMKSSQMKAYFDWMYQIVGVNPIPPNIRSYKKLLQHLNGVVFTYTMDMDSQRVDDAYYLRYEFLRELNLNESDFGYLLDRDLECSILEVMVALAFRMEQQILTEEEFGDRTGLWFWTMVDSLGLTPMYDAKYNPDYTDEVLTRFLNREYFKNGSGGLFTVNGSRIDMRKTDIWYQMCAFVNTFV